jgi:hypothetical protein
MTAEIYFALAHRIYRIRYPSGETINLNPLQRLNPKVPELNFVSLAARRRAFVGPSANK